MLINPLKMNEGKELTAITEDRLNIVIANLVGHLIKYHADLLSEVYTNSENNKVVEKVVREVIFREYMNINVDINELVKKVLDRLFGYHILQKYIDDKDVSDIRTIAWNNIWIKKHGRWLHVNESFADEADYFNFVRYCVLKNNDKITEEKPMVVVSDRINKLRIEAGIPPVSVKAPTLVIRIHRPDIFTSLDELYTGESFMMSLDIYKFLLESVISGCNIIISGKGASGKTTLLRALIDKIPENVAITSNEETAELFCRHPNIIQRQILKNRESDKNITLENLTAHSLVMTNDAIVVGEIKGAEAMVFFDAISTGHRGYATVHSDSANMTLDRLVTLMKRDPQAQQYSDKYLKGLLAESVDLIIHMKNFRVNEISEIVVDHKNHSIGYNPLFKFEVQEIVNGETKGTFKMLNPPSEKVKTKMSLIKTELGRIYGGNNNDS